MKRAKQSICKTVEMIRSKWASFDYEFFSRMVIGGMIQDGFMYVEIGEGGACDWLTAVDMQTKSVVEIDLYKEFSKLPEFKS